MSRSTTTALGLAMMSIASLTITPDLGAQVDTTKAVRVSRSRPRFGMTFLRGDVPKGLKYKYNMDVGSTITQFGWQFEKEIYSGKTGPTALTEIVLLAGALEQNEFLPSASWIIGMRTRSDLEFGVGPNFGRGGHGMVFAVGQTFRTGALNIPVNIAWIPGEAGDRISILSGFNILR